MNLMVSCVRDFFAAASALLNAVKPMVYDGMP